LYTIYLTIVTVLALSCDNPNAERNISPLGLQLLMLQRQRDLWTRGEDTPYSVRDTGPAVNHRPRRKRLQDGLEWYRPPVTEWDNLVRRTRQVTEYRNITDLFS